MLTREIKQILTDTLTPLVLNHQKMRALQTDEIVEMFMTPRKLEL